MQYNSLFIDDWRVILLGIICLLIILGGGIICLFHNKIPFVKKWFSAKRMVFIMFILALIIGLSVAAANHFQIFEETNQNDIWIRQLIYLMSTVINVCVTTMFLGFIIILPFRYFLTLFMFRNFRKPKQKIIKVSVMYFFFGGIALLIAASEYFMKDSFFSFASEFSNHPEYLSWDNHPTLFYISNFLLIKVFQIKGSLFSFIFFFTLIGLIICEWVIVRLLYAYNIKLLRKIIRISNKASDNASWLTLISPVFTFTAMMTSLMVQTIATFLRISLVFILFIMLFVTIYLINLLYSLSTRSISFKEFSKSMWKATKMINKNPISQSLINEIKKNDNFRGFKDFNQEQEAYNIFLTTIFPLVICAYLGFSSGPLLTDIPFYEQLYFWIMIYALGYVLMFAYAFKYSDLIAFKMVLNNATPFIRSGFNLGILNFFNNFLNKLSLYSTFSMYLAIACKHDKHYKKVIKQSNY